MTNVQLIYVDPRTLKELPTKNPNVMDPATYESLVQAIRTDGFLQSLLIVDEDGEYYIIDGVHRRRAAVEVGLTTVPALVAPDRARAEVLRIALNKMRGELDISEVTRQLQTLLDTGFTNEELQLTGFQSWEIEAMLENLNADEDDTLLGSTTTLDTSERPKTYSLNFKFDTESDRARVREVLESAGSGNALAGLLQLVNDYER